MRSAATALLALTVCAACGEQAGAPPARFVENEARGVALELPAGWQEASGSLTPTLMDPREVLSVGTFPLRYRRTACAHVPGSALEDLGPGDGFVSLLERGYDPHSSWTEFQPRPTHFGPHLGGSSEAPACVPGARFTDHWLTFADRDRHFYAHVAFGPNAPPEVRHQAWEILDSLRIDPEAKPDWRSVG